MAGERLVRLPKLLILTVGGIVGASFMILFIHPIQLGIIGVLTAVLVLLLRGGNRAEPPRRLYYEMREEDGLLHLVIQAREHVVVEVVGNTVKIVAGGVRELVKLPWAGILRNMHVVNNVVTAVISPAGTTR